MTSPVENELVAQATADLAQRLAMARDAIQLLSVEAVEWRDSSLGVPEPGRMYAQVITDGYRITLQADARQYRYHSDGQRVLFAGSD